MTETLGLCAAVTSALCWAISIVKFQDALDARGPGPCNFYKATLGAVFFSLIALVKIVLDTDLLPDLGIWIALLASGVVGFAIGDLLFFTSMRLVGARQGTLLQSTYPLFLLVFSFTDPEDHLTLLETWGVCIVVVGVLDVSRHQGRATGAAGRVLLFGTLAGLGAALGQAVGLVIAHDALDRCDFLVASAIRLIGASGGMWIGYAIRGNPTGPVRLLFDREMFRLSWWAIVIGTFFGIAAMMLAIALARTATAGALMSLTPVFLVPLTSLMRGDPWDLRVLLGITIAVTGVILVVSG